MKWFRRWGIVVVLMISMLLTLIRLPVYANDTGITVEGSTIYANGTSFRLKKDSDGKNYIYNLNGETKLLDTAVSPSTIYGGGKNSSVNSNIEMIIENVNVGTIHGGGYSDGTRNADVNGNVVIRIIGNANGGTIYGGGYAYAQKGNAQANVTGSIKIEVSATPTTNHGNITCGGHAYTNGAYQAIAQTGSTNGYVTDRTYSIRGGGSATSGSGAAGYANADVNGNVTLNVDYADIREVYGGGYASGNAQANVNLVTANIYNNTEIMILQGGGQASQGIANANQVALSLNNCSNIYGYIRAGGTASGGGSANISSTSLSIQNSVIPADTQDGNIVAAGIYGGGSASGAGSNATVGHVSMDIGNSSTAGTIYSGGKTYDGGIATVTSANAYYHQLTGNIFNGSTYYSTVIGGGSGADASAINISDTQMRVQECVLENIWGGGENGSNPLSLNGNADLMLDDEITLQSLANFDSITLNAPLHASMMMGKTLENPTLLIADDELAVGTPLVYCDDIVEMENTFLLNNGKLDYVIEENQSVWKVGQMIYTIETKASSGGKITETQSIHKNGTSTIQWVPDNEYEVISVVIDGQPYDLTENSYTFTGVRENHNIEVTFRKIPGIIKEQVEVGKGNNTKLPDLQVHLDKNLATDLLTEEDKAIVADGKNVEFNLKMEEVTKIPNPVVQGLKTVIDEENVLLSLDLTFSKNVAGAISSINQTLKPIRITIMIPQAYLDQSNGREFAVIRSHVNADGTITTDILKDLDDDKATITFETDRFSIYTLIYDVPKAEQPLIPPKPDNEEEIPHPSGEGDSTTSIENETPKTIDQTAIKNVEETLPSSIDTGDQIQYKGYMGLCIGSMVILGMLLVSSKKHSIK